MATDLDPWSELMFATLKCRPLFSEEGLGLSELDGLPVPMPGAGMMQLRTRSYGVGP